MKNRRLLIVVIIPIIIIMLLPSCYVIRKTLDPFVNVLCSTNEAFLFIQETTAGQSGTALSILLKTWMPVFPQADDKRDDMVVVHIIGGQATKTEIRGFGLGGGAFPLNGELYFNRGSQQANMPLLWKWSSNGFERVENMKALQIMNTFSSIGDLIVAQGWKESSIKFQSGEKNNAIVVGTVEYRLKLIQKVVEGSIVRTIKLEGRDVGTSEETLVNVSAKPKVVGKHEYFEEFEIHPSH